MKVFVATEPLGEDGDFSFTVSGELVHLRRSSTTAPIV
jgi:hypothetical protein